MRPGGRYAGGRVLDGGPPAQLVARHAGWATVEFGWPAPQVEQAIADLRGLPGVQVLRHIADVLPLTLVTNSVREPWLGNATGTMMNVVGLSIVAGVAAARRARL